MRYLGIDYGEKRIGLALSDESGKIAMPYGVANSFNKILSLLKKEKVGKIVIGLPVSFSGRESAQALETKKFAEALKKKVKLPIELENEVLSTKIASRFSSNGQIDASSAAIILQSYLDKQNKFEGLGTSN